MSPTRSGTTPGSVAFGPVVGVENPQHGGGMMDAVVLHRQESGVPERRRPALEFVSLSGGPGWARICDAAATCADKAGVRN